MRRCGTTTLLKYISHTNDVLVVVATNKEAIEYKKGNAITIAQLKDKAKYAYNESKPILIDTHVMIILLEELGAEITDLNNEISAHDLLLNTFHKLIHDFQRGKRPYYSERNINNEHSFILPGKFNF